ncbi:HEAT repeat domain-containing protein [Bacteriovoracaceae bacterium]|nr:HEAT repeat domain-containing protein [Bacteriovoracaceae bacterium]
MTNNKKGYYKRISNYIILCSFIFLSNIYSSFSAGNKRLKRTEGSVEDTSTDIVSVVKDREMKKNKWLIAFIGNNASVKIAKYLDFKDFSNFTEVLKGTKWNQESVTFFFRGGKKEVFLFPYKHILGKLNQNALNSKEVTFVAKQTALLKSVMEIASINIQNIDKPIKALCESRIHPTIMNDLLKLIESDNNNIDYVVVKILKQIKPTNSRILDALVNVLENNNLGDQDQDPNHIRNVATRTLGILKPKELKYHKALIDIVKNDASEYMVSDALVSLFNIVPTDPSIHQDLAEALLNDDNEYVAHEIIEVLEKVSAKDPVTIDALIDYVHAATDSQEEHVLHSVGRTIEMLNQSDLTKKATNRYIKALIEALDIQTKYETYDQDTVAILSAKTFGQMKPDDPRVNRALTKVLQTGRNSDVRKAAANAIGKIIPIDPEINKALIEARNLDTDLDVKEEARKALNVILLMSF